MTSSSSSIKSHCAIIFSLLYVVIPLWGFSQIRYEDNCSVSQSRSIIQKALRAYDNKSFDEAVTTLEKLREGCWMYWKSKEAKDLKVETLSLLAQCYLRQDSADLSFKATKIVEQLLFENPYFKANQHSSFEEFINFEELITSVKNRRKEDCSVSKGRRLIDRITISYNNGRFYQAVANLDTLRRSCWTSWRSKDARYLKVETLSLLAKNYLALDSLSRATKIVEQLLLENPYFEANQPLSFVKLINDVKNKGLGFSVSSVSKKPEGIYRTPATVVVMTQAEIRRRGYIDLDQMFDDLPGFDISRTMATTYSNIFQRGYRSNNTNRTIFMINGIEDNDFWGNISYWARQIPLTNVEKVEIVYGPASTMYGKNALVGVVNVITKNPYRQLGENGKLGVSVDGGYGTYNTRYGDLTVTHKLKNQNVFISVTGRAFLSDEMSETDLASFQKFTFDEFDYDPAFYETFDYATELGLDKVKEDSLVQLARELDIAALDVVLNTEAVGYSNLLEQYFLTANVKIGDFTLGYQWWKSTQGSTNWGTDNSRPGARNGSIWEPVQSTLFAKFERPITRNLVLSNTTQFRTSEITDRSRLFSLSNYSNGRLTLSDLQDSTTAFWQAQFLSQQSKQFREELRLIYTPFKGMDIVGGAEYRFSKNQGDYQQVTTRDSAILEDGTIISSSQFGRSSLDDSPGGNDLNYQEIGAYLQGTYSIIDSKNHAWLSTTLGGRFDYGVIGKDGGFGDIFSPRAALVFSPPDFLGDGSRFVLKGIYARAFQDAASRDRYAIVDPNRLLNNPSLRPETAENIEGVFGYYLDTRLRFELSYYSARYENVVNQIDLDVCRLNNQTGPNSVKEGACDDDRNKIDEVPLDGKTIESSQNQNLGEITIDGVQASLSLNLLKSLSFYANYTYTNPRSRTIIELNRGTDSAAIVRTDTLTRVGDIANHHFNLGANLSLFDDKLNINLRGNYVSAQPVGSIATGGEIDTTVPSNPQENGRFEPYILLNGAITIRNLMPELEGIQIQGIVNNILNTEYVHPGIRNANGTTQSYRIPQRRRNFMVRLMFDLK